MSFFLITYGMFQIEEIYIGKTPLEALNNAKELISSWPEYNYLPADELIELAEDDNLEFDLVEIFETMPEDKSKENLIRIYKKYF